MLYFYRGVWEASNSPRLSPVMGISSKEYILSSSDLECAQAGSFEELATKSLLWGSTATTTTKNNSLGYDDVRQAVMIPVMGISGGRQKTSS